MMTMSSRPAAAARSSSSSSSRRLAVDALQHERGAVVRPERAAVGLDQPERILALDAAEEVEHEEEEEPLGQAELRPCDLRRGRHADGHGHDEHGLLGDRSDQRAHVLAPDPDLVHDVERGAQVLRAARPPPTTSSRWCGARRRNRGPASYANCSMRSTFTQTMFVAYGWPPPRSSNACPWRVGARVYVVVTCGISAAVEPVHQQASGLADSELRAEVAGHVDALAERLAASGSAAAARAAEAPRTGCSARCGRGGSAHSTRGPASIRRCGKSPCRSPRQR